MRDGRAEDAHPVHAATPPGASRRHARIAVVQVAMTMPVMEPDLDATVLRNWAGAIDEGPFSSLCWGERIAFENPDSLTLLGALAAWTRSGAAGDHGDRAAAARPDHAGQGARDRRRAVRRAVDRGHRRGRAARGLPRRRRRPGHADDARHGRTRGGDEAGVGRRKAHRLGAAGRAGSRCRPVGRRC